MAILSTLCSCVLIGSSGYAMAQITPSAPFAFAACGALCCHGVISFLCSLADSEYIELSKKDTLHTFSHNSMMVAPLPIYTLQLLLRTKYDIWLLVHGAITAVVLILSILKNSSEDEEAAGKWSRRRSFAALGYLGELLTLGYLESDKLSLTLAGSALMTWPGFILMEGATSHQTADDMLQLAMSGLAYFATLVGF